VPVPGRTGALSLTKMAAFDVNIHHDPVQRMGRSRFVLPGGDPPRRGRVMESELVQFILLLVLFATVLVGAYWFVYFPGGNDRRRGG